MIETEITILVNRKSDLDTIKQKIIDSQIRFPVYILEDKNHFQINFVSDYEEWELDKKILNSFTDYEFTDVPEKGRKEIRLQLSRYQSEFSTDGWGRRIENPLNETKFLVKKSNNLSSEPETFNSEIKVLFEGKEQIYYVNMVNGSNRATGKEGFLLTNNFKSLNQIREENILTDRLYTSTSEAFNNGYYKLQEVVNQDFKEYVENQKKEIKQQQKVPRKIIRDFINSCNKYEIEGILRNLDDRITFARIVNSETKYIIEGIQEFEEYLKSTEQELCALDFIIRSPWNIKLPSIIISVKFFQSLINNEKDIDSKKIYRKITFELNDTKITSILLENLFGT